MVYNTTYCARYGAGVRLLVKSGKFGFFEGPPRCGGRPPPLERAGGSPPPSLSDGQRFDEHCGHGDGHGETESGQQPLHVADGHSDAVRFRERPVLELARQPFLLQIVGHAVGEK